MRCLRGFLACGFSATLVAAAPATAEVLYDDGLPNGTLQAWFIDSYGVADSFTLGSSSLVTDVTFDSWTFAGVAPAMVDWTIASLPDGTGATYGSGTATLTPTFLFNNGVDNNGLGFDIYRNSFPVTPLNLAAGTYWLVLSNSITSNPIVEAGWDVNFGPSQGWLGSLPGGYLSNDYCAEAVGLPAVTSCGNTFQILGPAQSSVPEPASLSLAASALGLLALLRTRRKAA